MGLQLAARKVTLPTTYHQVITLRMQQELPPPTEELSDEVLKKASTVASELDAAPAGRAMPRSAVAALSTTEHCLPIAKHELTPTAPGAVLESTESFDWRIILYVSLRYHLSHKWHRHAVD